MKLLALLALTAFLATLVAIRLYVRSLGWEQTTEAEAALPAVDPDGHLPQCGRAHGDWGPCWWVSDGHAVVA